MPRKQRVVGSNPIQGSPFLGCSEFVELFVVALLITLANFTSMHSRYFSSLGDEEIVLEKNCRGHCCQLNNSNQ